MREYMIKPTHTIYHRCAITPSRCAVRIFVAALLVLSIQWSFGQTSCVSPPSGLVSWWPANGNAQDVIGGNNGILTNGVTFAAGEVGQAFSFNGSNDYVQVPNSPLWNFGTNAFTIELWANFNATNGTQAFLSFDNGGGGQNKWILFYGYNGAGLTFHLNGTSGALQIDNVPFSPVVGQWYHIALTRNGSTWTFYVNGAPVGTATATVTVPAVTAPLS